jgi:hypothetical protein
MPPASPEQASLSFDIVRGKSAQAFQLPGGVHRVRSKALFLVRLLGLTTWHTFRAVSS